MFDLAKSQGAKKKEPCAPHSFWPTEMLFVKTVAFYFAAKFARSPSIPAHKCTQVSSGGTKESKEVWPKKIERYFLFLVVVFNLDGHTILFQGAGEESESRSGVKLASSNIPYMYKNWVFFQNWAVCKRGGGGGVDFWAR